MVADSKVGWAKALRQLLAMLWQGTYRRGTCRRFALLSASKDHGRQWHLDHNRWLTCSRPVGMFTNAAGRKLNLHRVPRPWTCIGQAIVVGGVRRSALISTRTPVDDYAHGQVWSRGSRPPAPPACQQQRRVQRQARVRRVPQRDEQPVHQLLGERGFFNREGQEDRGTHGRRDPDHDFGCNPCAEIALPSQSACNLSEVIIRETTRLRR